MWLPDDEALAQVDGLDHYLRFANSLQRGSISSHGALERAHHALFSAICDNKDNAEVPVLYTAFHKLLNPRWNSRGQWVPSIPLTSL